MIKIQREDGNWEELSLNCTEEITTPFDMIDLDVSHFARRAEFTSFEIVGEKPNRMIGIHQFWNFFLAKGRKFCYVSTQSELFLAQ